MQRSDSDRRRGGRLGKRLATGLTALALCAAVGWWFGPASAPYRYQRMDLVSLRQMLDQSPRNALGWKTLGLRLARDGDASMAEDALLQAYALNPSDAEVATQLAEILLAQRHVPEAFQTLKTALARHPDYAPAHLALARLYHGQKSYLHACEEYETAVKGDAGNAPAWYELATCYLETQQIAKAQTAIAQAIRLKPAQPEYLALKGSLDASVGNLDAGLAAMEQAAHLAPASLLVQTTYANILLTYHRNEADLNRAEQVIGIIEQIDAQYPLLAYQHGELERLRGNWPQAARYLERALKAAPERDEIYYALGQTYQRLHRTAQADKVLAVYSRRQYLHREMGNTQMQIESQPANTDLYVKLSELQAAFGDLRGAIDSLNAALKLDPARAPLKTRLAQLQQQLASSGRGNP